jgi:superfamily II DNA or RNA helicase
MNKAVLSNRIYLNTNEELTELLEKTLTYEIEQKGPNPLDQPTLIIRNATRIKEGLYSIPSGRTDLIPKDYILVDKRSKVKAELPEFRFKLRPSQQEIYSQVTGSCLINAPVSYGKTFLGLAIAAKLGYKTLVIVHTIALRDQWEKEIEKCFGVKAGIIGSGRFELDSPIILGNIQTVRKRVPKLMEEFGTVIVDECHHTPAATFTDVLNKLKAEVKIGLSGTLQRKDNRHIVLKDYFGFELFQPPVENSMKPEIYILNTNIFFSSNRNVPWALRVNDLVKRDDYKNLVADVAQTQAIKGHKVLVVADRVQFLEDVSKLCGSNAIVITGATQNRDKLMKSIDEDKDILCGSISIFSEGISLNSLSCLVLATPINNEPMLTQLIGRIIRVKEGKLTPEVIDLNLKGSTANNQATARCGLYLKLGYNIHNLS